jgi:hypothetical protein
MEEQKCDYIIENGTDKIIDFSKEIHDIPSFMGYCYYCDYSKHSQNYCPLGYCSICNTYGHNFKVCTKNTAQGCDDWRTKIKTKSQYFFKNWKKNEHENRDLKIQFGSTWKQNNVLLPSQDSCWRKSVKENFGILINFD